jgi:hypothetical protein
MKPAKTTLKPQISPTVSRVGAQQLIVVSIPRAVLIVRRV